MNSKHTPGPWTVEHGRIIRDADGNDIAKAFADDVLDGAELHNARLIAAAPDLLAALSTMLGAAEFDCLDDKSNVWRSAMIDARAALAKATAE